MEREGEEGRVQGGRGVNKHINLIPFRQECELPLMYTHATTHTHTHTRTHLEEHLDLSLRRAKCKENKKVVFDV